jgi:selenide,water dikinase
LCGLPLMHDPNLIVGMESGDDAGVYKLSDDLAIVQTIDFITPIVDDPYTFGQIAAANSLSDVYAMGGKPVTAMNVVCFPVGSLDISVLKQILHGGLDKMREAGVVLVGGHSVDDEELKYGLSVTGVVHPDKVVVRDGARLGDRLILTKPLGTGIMTTALKGGVVDDETLAPVVSSMTTLNMKASELMQEMGVNACTDITGFGLVGHARGMIDKNKLGLEIRADAIPVFRGVREFSEMGLVPGGTGRNMDFYRKMIDLDRDIDQQMLDILFDPQTSGGLLIAVPKDKAETLLKKLHRHGISQAAIIGEVVSKPAGKIVIRK